MNQLQLIIIFLTTWLGGFGMMLIFHAIDMRRNDKKSGVIK